ncbi:MAG: helix-turn-helix domain-containing protein [Actinomycetota bacterium]
MSDMVELDAPIDRRSEIAAAARACFQRWGLAKTTMDDIAKEVGIARPNLYRYFPNKAALASAVSAAESARINDRRRSQIRIEGPTASLIERSVVMGLELALADDYLVDLMTSDNQELVPATIEDTDTRYDYWRPIFEHGRARGELRDDTTDDDLLRWLSSVQLHFLSNRELFPSIVEIARDVRMFVVPAMVARQ